MLEVGIHENVSLSNETGINDKETFEIVLEIKQTKGLWDTLNAGESAEEQKGKFLQWSINMEDFKTKNAKSAAVIATELKAYESFLKKFLKVYMTEDKIEKYFGGMIMFEGQGVNEDNIESKLLDEDSVKSIHLNISGNFLKACKDENIFESTDTFRIKLPRQKADIHFPRLPYNTNKSLWIESMVVPLADSKIGWDKYEVDKGLNHSNPIASDTVSTEEGPEANSLFGNKAEEEPNIED